MGGKLTHYSPCLFSGLRLCGSFFTALSAALTVFSSASGTFDIVLPSYTKYMTAVPVHLPGECIHVFDSSNLSNVVTCSEIGNPSKPSGIHGSLVCVHALVPRETSLKVIPPTSTFPNYWSNSRQRPGLQLYWWLSDTYCRCGAYADGPTEEHRVSLRRQQWSTLL